MRSYIADRGVYFIVHYSWCATFDSLIFLLSLHLSTIDLAF